MNPTDAPDPDDGQCPAPMKPAPSAPTVSAGGSNKAADAIKPFKEHQAYRLVELAERLTGVSRDLVQAAIIYSLAAGRMGMPLHLDVQTDQLVADLHIVNRILDVAPENVDRVSTHREFRRLERRGFQADTPFGEDDEPSSGDSQGQSSLYAIFIRGVHRTLHREATECTTRVADGISLPSILRVVDAPGDEVPAPTMLRLQARQAARRFENFGRAFAGSEPDRGAGEEIARLIDRLPFRPVYQCHSGNQFRGNIAPLSGLVFERMLALFTALRLASLPCGEDRRTSTEDYRAARAFVLNLPLMPSDRFISGAALGAASALYLAVRKEGNGVELPDRSESGATWFTRTDATKWAGLGYSSAKKYLRELEDEGVVESTLHQSNRERGKQIHFRFVDGRTPPFRWKSPFEGLPELHAPKEV